MLKKISPQNKIGFKIEKAIKANGFEWVIGIDEAGRGPLAGPVVSAAVLLRKKEFSVPINDSKLLTPAQRNAAFNEITSNADIGIGVISETAIDTCNILQATFHAMDNAVNDLISHIKQRNENIPEISKTCLLIDGNRFISDLPYPYRTIVEGDKKSLSIACASIVAKVTRDRMLNIYDQIYPQYGFAKHKGYGTEFHRKAIEQYGHCAIHRKSFHLKDQCHNEKME